MRIILPSPVEANRSCTGNIADEPPVRLHWGTIVYRGMATAAFVLCFGVILHETKSTRRVLPTSVIPATIASLPDSVSSPVPARMASVASSDRVTAVEQLAREMGRSSDGLGTQATAHKKESSKIAEGSELAKEI